MKSQHPEYLESFVKTCMAYGLDEEATTVLLDNARHKDYLENSPEYCDGFHSTLLELNSKNAHVKSALLGWLGRGAVGLGKGIQRFTRFLDPLLTSGGKKTLTTAKKPGFLPGLATVPIGYGLFEGGKGLYEKGKEKFDEMADRYSLNRAMSGGDLPSLNQFGVTSGGNKGKFADALYAMQAADARMGGDVRPLLSSNADANKSPILPSLRKRLFETETAINSPITDPSDYGSLSALIKSKMDLQKQLRQAERYTQTAAPILENKTRQLQNLADKYKTKGKLSDSEMQQFEQLSSQVPSISNFRKQLGQ